MIQIEIILVVAAVILLATMIKLVLELKDIFRDMDRSFDRIIMRCDNMIEICDGAGTARKRLIKSRGRK